MGRYVFAPLIALALSLVASHALAVCGDSVLDANEECDPGGALYLNGDPLAGSCSTGSNCYYEATCCKFNCQFVGQGNVCSDGNDCTENDQCDQVGNCDGGAVPPGQACDDGLFCTLSSVCNGSGVCVGSGDPCAGGGECAGACDEGSDSCYVPNGTPCGDPTSNDCTAPDTCDGAGGCEANDAVAGSAAPVLCDDTNECTSDQCDGAGGCAYQNVAFGTSCGDPGTTDCTAPDSCDGAGSCSPNDALVGTACGDPTATACTGADSCDGAGSCAANDSPAGTAASVLCDDVNECTSDECDGTGGCQNPPQPPGFACGNPLDDDCTDPDACDGAGGCSSQDAPAGTAADTLCADANACTLDQCDGGGGCQHPPASAGSSCGDPADTDCTDPDTCDGAGACQSNDEPAGLSSALQCDDANVCTNDECNGAGGCQHPGVLAGTPCGDGTDDDCKNPDECDGAGFCSPNDEIDGTSCDDGLACTQIDECEAGACIGKDAVDCDDGNPCTTDECTEPTAQCSNVAQPNPVCLEAALSSLAVVDNASDRRDNLKWRWQRGGETLFEDFGDPDSVTTYDLCIYDEYDPGLYSLESRVVVAPGSNWQARGDRGWKYKDRSGSSDGTVTIRFKPGGEGRPKLVMKAKGENLPTPTPVDMTTFFAVNPSVAVQLSNDAGHCWKSEFSDAPFRNTGQKFKTVRRVLVP